MKFLILIIIGLGLVGCGVKGPPTPAYSTKPEFDVSGLPFAPNEDADSDSKNANTIDKNGVKK